MKKSSAFPRQNTDFSSWSDAIFIPGEKVVFNLPNIRICEKTGADGFKNGTDGSITPIDEGILIFTRKSLAFYAGKKSLEVPLDKIITLRPMKNGIAVSVSGSGGIQYFLGMTEFYVWFICIYISINAKSNIDWMKN